MISIIKTTYQNQGFESQRTEKLHEGLNKEDADRLIKKAFEENNAECIVPLSVKDIKEGIFLITKPDADFLSIWAIKNI